MRLSKYLISLISGSVLLLLATNAISKKPPGFEQDHPGFEPTVRYYSNIIEDHKAYYPDASCRTSAKLALMAKVASEPRGATTQT